MRRSWRRTATVPLAARAAGSCWISESNSGPTTSARLRTSLRAVDTSDRRASPAVTAAVSTQHAERDRHHRDHQAGAESPVGTGH